jgi:solute carrier family 25 (adenine nucleotide translocator) protein 4/5/6/31
MSERGHSADKDDTIQLPQTQNKKIQRPQWREAVAGAFAGAISRTLLAPIERIKLLKQLQISVKDEFAANQSAWKVAIKVYREQGGLAFWRGNFPNVLRVSGTAAINFTCMDYYKRAAVSPVLERFQQHYKSKLTPEELQRRCKLAASFISGGLAGATATTLLYPIEFVRTRLAMDTGGADVGRPRKYSGMMDVSRKIYRSDGILGFFQGYGIALTGGVVYRILLLGGYDALKGELLFRKTQQTENSTSPQISWGERIISAQCISLTAGTIAYPFDSVRRRMMMQSGQPMAERQYRNSVHCIRSVLGAEGIRGFYLGLGPNIVRSVSGALLLVGYDRIRSFL